MSQSQQQAGNQSFSVADLAAAQKAYESYNQARAKVTPHYEKAQPYIAKIQQLVGPYVEPIDRELSRFPKLVQFEQQTGIKKAYLGIGVFGFFAFFIFFNIAAGLLSNSLGFFIPAYYSMKALQSPGHDDDTQWLVYWCVYGCLSLIESFTDQVLFWFPFYYTFKTILLIWLMLPQTRGAVIIYSNILRPFFFGSAAGTVPQRFNSEGNSGLFKESAAPASTSAAPAAASTGGATGAQSTAIPQGLSSALHNQAGSGNSTGGLDFSALASQASHLGQQAPGQGAGGFHIPPEAQQALNQFQHQGNSQGFPDVQGVIDAYKSGHLPQGVQGAQGAQGHGFGF